MTNLIKCADDAKNTIIWKIWKDTLFTEQSLSISKVKEDLGSNLNNLRDILNNTSIKNIIESTGDSPEIYSNISMIEANLVDILKVLSLIDDTSVTIKEVYKDEEGMEFVLETVVALTSLLTVLARIVASTLEV